MGCRSEKTIPLQVRVQEFTKGKNPAFDFSFVDLGEG